MRLQDLRYGDGFELQARRDDRTLTDWPASAQSTCGYGRDHAGENYTTCTRPPNPERNRLRGHPDRVVAAVTDQHVVVRITSQGDA